jgi:uncharacterized protein (UPF0333 family)
MKGNKKGQAALEYLMTYGWAILVIVIVLGILLLLFTNMSRVEKCLVTPQGFTCGNANPIIAAPANGGDLSAYIKFQNGQADSVKITRVLCIKGAEPSDMTVFNGKGDLSSMVEVLPGSSYTGNSVPCYDSTGTLAKSNVNQPFTGVVLVYYKLGDDIGGDAPSRKAIMSISSTVTQAS